MDAAPLTSRQLAPGDGQTYRLLGDLVTVKAVAADTGGAYALFEACTAPGEGTPPHVQRYDDETVFVLEGTYAVQIGQQTVELGPGGYVFVPRGTAHAYTNVGAGPARLLLLVSPGGIHELFLAEVGQPVAGPVARPEPDGRTDIAQVVAAAEKYGIEFQPPTG